MVQEVLRGLQPEIAVADQCLPCVCSPRNLPHVGAGKWFSSSQGSIVAGIMDCKVPRSGSSVMF